MTSAAKYRFAAFMKNETGSNLQMGSGVSNRSELAVSLPEKEQRDLLQVMFGVIHHCDTSHQKIFFQNGKGRAGKGLDRDIADCLVGHQSAGIDAKALSYTFSMSSCFDKDLIFVNELREFDASGVAVLKAASGGDFFRVANKYRGASQGRIKGNWVLTSNENVVLDDASGGIVTRLAVLKFNVSFLGREDIYLKDKLRSEMNLIAAWAREGYQRFLRDGKLPHNPHAEETTRTLEESASPIKAFIEQCTKPCKGNEQSKKELYVAYLDWCQGTGNGDSTISQAKFTRDLKTSTNLKEPETNNRVVVGIQLLPRKTT